MADEPTQGHSAEAEQTPADVDPVSVPAVDPAPEEAPPSADSVEAVSSAQPPGADGGETVSPAQPSSAEGIEAVSPAEPAGAEGVVEVPVPAEPASAAAGPRSAPRSMTGVVVSSKADKTISVRIERRVKHPVYGKFVRRSTKLAAHDQNNDCQEGDIVTILETRPISKSKSWRLASIVERASAIGKG